MMDEVEFFEALSFGMGFVEECVGVGPAFTGKKTFYGYECVARIEMADGSRWLVYADPEGGESE